jgi:hypothetical protein
MRFFSRSGWLELQAMTLLTGMIGVECNAEEGSTKPTGAS